MFRITQYLKNLYQPTPIGPVRKPPGPVVIWNLVRRCNLTCKHCYSISADIDFPDELSTEQVCTAMEDLKSFGVPVLILSGGEPLLRNDIFTLAKKAKKLGFYVGLSSNGTLINKSNIDRIAEVGFDYVGISLDGLKENHDKFRQMAGGFEAALNGIDLCVEAGIKVGMRFTLTEDNCEDLPALLQLMESHNVEKFYLSHLNYAGRGKRNRKRDAFFQTTRKAMDLLFERAWQDVISGSKREYVTGNNDADGPYLLQWAAQNLSSPFSLQLKNLEQRLVNWGGNSSGVNIANIDNTGTVHPDTFWWNYDLGNIKEQPFSEIWRNPQDSLMQGFRQQPRPIKGRCRDCQYLSICNGNTRVRALTTSGDPWQEDPGCYLDDCEIGLSNSEQSRIAAVQV